MILALPACYQQDVIYRHNIPRHRAAKLAQTLMPEHQPDARPHNKSRLCKTNWFMDLLILRSMDTFCKCFGVAHLDPESFLPLKFSVGTAVAEVEQRCPMGRGFGALHGVF